MNPSSNMKKRCSKCGVEKDISKFGKDKNRKDKHNYQCKKCYKEYNSKWYQENREKNLERKKKWYQKNREKFLDYNKKYCQENREKIKIRERKYRQKNRKKISEKSKEYYQEHKEEAKKYCQEHKEEAKEYYQKNKERQKKYRQENREELKKKKKKYHQKPEIKKRFKEHYQENREKFIEYSKKYRQENNEYGKKYYQENREKIKEYQKKPKVKKRKNKRLKKRYKEDPMFRLNMAVRGGIHYSLKGNKAGKKWKTLVDFTFEDLKKQLKKRFDGKINMENIGTYWDIDHIIAQSLFKFTKPEDPEFKLCWTLENLQPLESRKNQSKNNKLRLSDIDLLPCSYIEKVDRITKGRIFKGILDKHS